MFSRESEAELGLANQSEQILRATSAAQAHDPVDSYKLGWTGVTCKTLWVSVVGFWMQPLLKIEVCRFTINELY